MFRLLIVSILIGALAACAGTSHALKLLSPTPDQTVRENVKIVIPVSELPPDFVVSKDETAPESGRPYLTLSVGSGESEQLIAAISPDMGTVRDGAITFYWDSKAPYRDPKDPRNERFYKDGRYTLKIEIHDFLGKLLDSATVDVNLKNRIARSNPAPAVSLVNRLVFGERHLYDVHAAVQVFQVVGVGKSGGTGLPILGGMGMTSDFKIIQSVEDRRPDGSYLLRCKMDDDGFLSSFGAKVRLFPLGQPTPELYRLVDKFGNVLKRNVFSRQGKYTMMDVLPVLPQKPVKEGDSWMTTCDLKIEGITGIIPLTGTSQLDSFEWQDGHECAKIISTLTGSSAISMDNNRIRSSSNNVTATLTTYFAYKTGKMVRREIMLDFPALVMPGAGQIEGTPGSETSGPSVYPSPDVAPPPGAEPTMDDGTEPLGPGPYGRSPRGRPSSSSGTEGTDTGTGTAKRGSVQIRVVVELEK